MSELRPTPQENALYHELTDRRDLLEVSLREHIDDTELAKINPAYYLKVQSRPGTVEDLLPRLTLKELVAAANLGLERPISHEFTATTYELRKYTGVQPISFGQRRVSPGDYFWEMHIELEGFIKEFPVRAKMHKILEEIDLFFELMQEEPESYGHIDDHSFTLNPDAVVIGGISHVGRLMHRIVPELSWDAKVTVPPEIFSLYMQLMQMKVHQAMGTRVVKESDMYSAAITRESLPSVIRAIKRDRY